jgi:hypothetical protein
MNLAMTSHLSAILTALTQYENLDPLLDIARCQPMGQDL